VLQVLSTPPNAMSMLLHWVTDTRSGRSPALPYPRVGSDIIDQAQGDCPVFFEIFTRDPGFRGLEELLEASIED